MGGGSGGLSSQAMGPQPGMTGATPGLMTSSPYVQPWAANAEGTPPPTGYDQMAPNPTASTYVDPLAPVVAKGAADVRAREFKDFPLKPMPEPKEVKDKMTFAGNLVANASATGGAYGMPAISYGGGPAYKNAAGKYFYDKEGKYPVPAEHLRLGGGGLK